MTANEKINVWMNVQLPRDLRREFQVECKSRDVTASHLIRDYLRKQLNHWRANASSRK